MKKKVVIVSTLPPINTSLSEYGKFLVEGLFSVSHNNLEITVLADIPEQSNLQINEMSSKDLNVIRCWKFNENKTPFVILKKLNEIKPDVVIFNVHFASYGNKKVPAFMGLSTPMFAKLMGFKVITVLHNMIDAMSLEESCFTQSKFEKLMIKAGGNVATRLLLKSDKLVVTLEKYKEILETKYNSENVKVIKLGTYINPIEKINVQNKNSLLTFGKFGTYKRLELLLEVFEELSLEHPDIELVIGGDDHPNTKGYINNLQEKYSYLKNVKFIGWIEDEDLPEIIKNSKALVLPYTATTGSSGPLHFGVAQGKPVIAPEIGDFVNVAKGENIDIIFYKPKDKESLKKQILALVNNEIDIKSMCINNLNAIQEQSFSNISGQYYQLINSVSDNSNKNIRTLQPKTLVSSGVNMVGIIFLFFTFLMMSCSTNLPNFNATNDNVQDISASGQTKQIQNAVETVRINNSSDEAKLKYQADFLQNFENRANSFSTLAAKSPKPKKTPKPSNTPIPSPSSPSPSATPSSSNTPVPSPSSPSPSATITPLPSSTPTLTPSSTPTPVPTSTPVSCVDVSAGSPVIPTILINDNFSSATSTFGNGGTSGWTEWGGDYFKDPAGSNAVTLYNPGPGTGIRDTVDPYIGVLKTGFYKTIDLNYSTGDTLIAKLKLSTTFTDEKTDATLVLVFNDPANTVVISNTIAGSRAGYQTLYLEETIPDCATQVTIVPNVFLGPNETSSLMIENISLEQIPAGYYTETSLYNNTFDSRLNNTYGTNSPDTDEEFGYDFYVVDNWPLKYAGDGGATVNNPGAGKLTAPLAGLVKYVQLGTYTPNNTLTAFMYAAPTFTDIKSSTTLVIEFYDATNTKIGTAKSSTTFGSNYRWLIIDRAPIPAGSTYIKLVPAMVFGPAETSSLLWDDLSLYIDSY